MKFIESPQSTELRELRSVLKTLGSGRDFTADCAAMAFYAVSGVVPPYPPVSPVEGGVTLEVARDALDAAIAAAPTVDELSRLIEVGEHLDDAATF